MVITWLNRIDSYLEALTGGGGAVHLHGRVTPNNTQIEEGDGELSKHKNG